MSGWAQAADTAGMACLLVGGALCFVAGVGLLRLPDVLSRLHAATKPQSLGVILVLIGVGLRLRTGTEVTTLALVAFYQITTTPVAAHMVGRAAYRTGRLDDSTLIRDELDELLSRPGDRSR